MGSLNILGIEGKKGAGKDTACEMLKAMSPIDIKRFAFADALKSELMTLMGLDGKILRGTTEQKDKTFTQYDWSHPRWDWIRKDQEGFITYREMMQIWGRMKGTQYWVNELFPKIYEYNDSYPDDIIVITDVRFPEEAQVIKDNGGSLLLIDGKESGDFNNDPSEAGGLPHDYIVHGKGLSPKSRTRAELCDVMWSAFGVNCRGN